jgi:hypothetical protein
VEHGSADLSRIFGPLTDARGYPNSNSRPT